MTADEFERGYAERSGLTVQQLRDFGCVVRPCYCGEDGCEGWQSISRELADQIELDMPEYFRAPGQEPRDNG